MARPLRIAFPGAIYHAIARGNNRQAIFLNEDDRFEYLDRLEQTVDRFGWELFSFVQMTNHTHQFFRTPEANLSDGMQFLLSGYASWFQRAHGRCGHVFQGRFRGELVEDESYFWAVSRYIHLNPMRTNPPLVDRLVDWSWSSYPGYTRPHHRLDWISYDQVLQAWQGGHGGGAGDATRQYRFFVESGVEVPPDDPFADAVDGWILGAERFVDSLRSKLNRDMPVAEVPQVRRFVDLELPDLLDRVTTFYGVSNNAVTGRRSPHPGRAVFAWLARQHTRATRQQLSEFLGLTHPDSVSFLYTKVRLARAASAEIANDVEAISKSLREWDGNTAV